MPLALIAFIVVPIVEMVILIEVGGIIGALPTVGLVVLTATLGIWLLRLEGMATLARVQTRLDRGELPETELLEGIMLIVGGALLLTPGFVTDAIGFACILPGLRRPIARWIIRRGVLQAVTIINRRAGGGPFDPGGPTDPRGRGDDIIEGDFTETDRKRGDHIDHTGREDQDR